MTTAETSFLNLGLIGKHRRPFNRENFEKDLALIKKLYTFKGYFFASVEAITRKEEDGRRIDIDIMIEENEPARIDTLSQTGLEALSDSTRNDYRATSLIRKGDIFSVQGLIAERDRTLAFFKNRGYTFFHEDSIRIKVDTVGTHAGITYQLHLPGKKRYGRVAAVVHNPQQQYYTEKTREVHVDSIDISISGDQNISPTLIASAITFRPGELTRENREQKSMQNLGATNIFSSVYIRRDSTAANGLATTLHLEPLPRHQLEPKVIADNRYGELFIGSALSYENRNLFGGAEQLRSTLEFGSQIGNSNNILTNLSPDEYDAVIPYEFSLKNSLIMPVLKSPGNYYTATLEYSAIQLPVLLKYQNSIVRGSYNARLSPSSRLNFDFFEVEWVQQDSIRGFSKLFRTDLAKNIGVDPHDNAAVNTAIDSLLETYINQTFRLTYSQNTGPRLTGGNTSWKFNMLAEFTGILPWLINETLNTKDNADTPGAMPKIFGTNYAQYVKLNPRLTMTRNLSETTQLAAKADIGWMAPWGKATATPDERRFYAGGPNSMRGWLYNTLGPGSSPSQAAANFGADIKLEMSMEYRLQFFRFLGQKSGVAFFSDIGNIWNRSGPYAFSLRSLVNDFAWDWGLGLRIGSPIGPFRFDFAWRIHDPTQEKRWMVSDWDLGAYTFNFGIGEAF